MCRSRVGGVARRAVALVEPGMPAGHVGGRHSDQPPRGRFGELDDRLWLRVLGPSGCSIRTRCQRPRQAQGSSGELRASSALTSISSVRASRGRSRDGVDEAGAVVGANAAQRAAIAMRPPGDRTVGDTPVARWLGPHRAPTDRTAQVLDGLPATLLTTGRAGDHDTTDRHECLLVRPSLTVLLRGGRPVARAVVGAPTPSLAHKA
jgi:hypothetical protein